ncbi:MAG TPA: alpha/beta fold hydrolase [Rhizomicrobium sp.]|nr:alpha/beta fold hydrolase [Rhizomicrobium sp.]
MAMLSGPRLPAARGQATHLVVLCHGYGADGNDLIGLAPHWQRLMPTAAFVAPNAPEPCAAGPGYQWFPISRLDPHLMRQGVERAAATLEAFLDAELARAKLSEDRLALVGFSQGTMMSLHVGLKRKPAAIVGYSGLLADVPAERYPDAPPVLLVHGDADPMIPAEYLFASSAALGRAGVPVQWHLSPDTAHAIDASGLALGGLFLSLAFRGLLKPKDPDISCVIQ